jgi:hypothetical protein
MKSVTRLYQAAFLIAGLASANPAFAQDALTVTDQAPIALAPAAEEIMSLEELGEFVGGTAGDSVVITDETLQAINHDNVVVGEVVRSGDITLANGGLSSFDGIGNFIMNTGHQNNLQSSMSVSILLGPQS